MIKIQSKFCQDKLFGHSQKLYFHWNFRNIHACSQQKHNQTYGVMAGGEWALVSVQLKDAGTSHGTVVAVVRIMANEAAICRALFLLFTHS